MGASWSNRQNRNTNVQDLLVRGKAAAKSGDQDEAIFYLEWVLRTKPTDQQKMEAWLWLSRLSETEEKKRHYLQQVLAHNPAHPRARRLLALLDGRLKEEDIVDPDQLRPHPGEMTRPADAHRFICPRCAARMVFSPDGETLYCEHCGYGQQPQARAAVDDEQDFIVTMAMAKGHLRPEAMLAFECAGCAATFILAPETLSLSCPYCEASYAVEVKETRELVPPQAIIPFQLTEAYALQAIERWLQGDDVTGRITLHGLYLPVWTFDITGAIKWTGQSRQYEPSTMSWRQVSGRHPIFYDDFLVPACDTLAPEPARIVWTFDLAQLVGFDGDYLAAWPAQTYQISVGDASLVARRAVFQEMRPKIEANIRADTSVEGLRLSSADMLVESYKLILLPVWLAHYRHQGRQYTVAVNGQKGNVEGERPPGWQRLRRWLNKLLS